MERSQSTENRDVEKSSKFEGRNNSSTAEELKPLIALYLQDTVQKGEPASYAGLKQLVRHQQRNNSECDTVEMQKDTSGQEKERDLRLVVLSNGDPKTIAIRTPRHVRICIYSGLNIVKENRKLQHGSCTGIFTRSAGRTKKIRIRLQEPSLEQESVMKKEAEV